MEIINEKHKITMPIRDYEMILNDKKIAEKELQAVWDTMKPDYISYYDFGQHQRVILYKPNETNAALIDNINKFQIELDKVTERRDELVGKLHKYSRHWFLRYFITLF